MTLSDLELIDIHARALFVHDAEDRLVEINTIERQTAPRLYLGRTVEGNIRRVRHDLPMRLVEELDAILVDEPVTAELQQRAATFDRLHAALSRHTPVERVWEGPAWTFPMEIPVSTDLQTQMVTAGMEIADERFRWLGDELEHWHPCVVLMRDGEIVSYCHSSRTSPDAAEAGVETLESFRGRGYGAAVVTAWVRAVREQGRTPLYSTSWNNLASQALGRKLGLCLYGADLHLT